MSTRGGENGSAATRQPASCGRDGAGTTVTRHFDGLSEDLIGVTLSYLGVRDLEVARHACKVFNLVALRFLPLWIGVARLAAGEASADGSGANELPAHIKPTLDDALAAFQRFRDVGPTGRSLEIRLVDNAAHATGWEVGPGFRRVPGEIGGGEFCGLQLDGEDRWRGLRIVTSGVEVVYGGGGRYSVVVTEGVTSIGNYAFYYCSGLTSVTFPEGLTSIGGAFTFGGAFTGCTGLTSVTFPEGLTSIGERAFYECTGLTSVTFPEGLTSIGKSAFCACTGLTSVTFPEGLTSIGGYAFYRCNRLTSVTIPNGAQLGPDTFSDDTHVCQESVNPCSLQ
jgi:hypothetical protein